MTWDRSLEFCWLYATFYVRVSDSRALRGVLGMYWHWIEMEGGMGAGPDRIAECVRFTVFNANIDSLLCYTLESSETFSF